MAPEEHGKIPIVFLFGPTGVGKTELVAELFTKGFEIVSTDALQVYRGMDIGTAKPTLKERGGIKHHLIDIRDPDQLFSAGDFVEESLKLIPDIVSRGNTPLFSGGTAFYFYNFLYGLPEAPKADQKVREQVLMDLEIVGLRGLYDELRRVDPERAEQLHPNDKTRILRALEVFRQTGEVQSSFLKSPRIREGFTFLIIGLNRERKALYDRINRRVDLMFSQGLPKEVEVLKRSGYGAEDPGMKGIGYREFFHYPDRNLEEVSKEIKKNSRHYAKRQLTFFSSLPNVAWFHPDQKDDIKKLLKRFFSSESCR